jgi:2-phospho-L-lactate guanylyltransferase
MNDSVALLVPVKAWDRAKSRLDADVPPRPVLAEAFALDAIDAALACDAVSTVYVVTDQAGFSPAGVTVLPDEGAGDLNAALRAAEARVTGSAGLVAAMCADLPCLVPTDLAEAVATCLAGPSVGRWCVADSPGTGTTLLLARGLALDPRFGRDSAARHVESGAKALEAPLSSLRLDVDTAEDLAAATRLGLGRHTRAALAAVTPPTR